MSINRLMRAVMILGGLWLSACAALAPHPGGTMTATPPPPSATTTAAPTRTHTPAPSATATATATATVTASATATATVTPAPTYVKLRGKVIIAQAVCHYGPGKPYLYKYAVIEGSNLEIIGRVESGEYIEVQAIGGNNPCWVKAEYMQIQGDLANVAPVRPEDVRLPQSPYYAPPSGAAATRAGDEVTVTWHPLVLRAGDDSEQTPYIVEAWVCEAGRLVFKPVGSYPARVTIGDEAGCSEASRARLLAAEKHGYTRPVEIAWPPAP